MGPSTRARRPVDDVGRRRRNRSRAVLGGQITHHAIHGTTPLAIFRRHSQFFERRERITRVRGRRAGRGGTRVRRRAMGFRRASHAGIRRERVRRRVGRRESRRARRSRRVQRRHRAPMGHEIARRCGRGGRRRTRRRFGFRSRRFGFRSAAVRTPLAAAVLFPDRTTRPPVIRAGRRRVASPRTATSSRSDPRGARCTCTTLENRARHSRRDGRTRMRQLRGDGLEVASAWSPEATTAGYP